MLSILALESQRHRCMVIGEDLGRCQLRLSASCAIAGSILIKCCGFENDPEKNFRAPKRISGNNRWPSPDATIPAPRGYWGTQDLTLSKASGALSG
ncbi:hypothetical protein KCP71_08400 [Salmonella enterica subsp. enterica]|nr:hypothetical protein KCP71_08400 [Salmonella enterica subsp. enterica]